MLGWLYRVLVGSMHAHKWAVIQSGSMFTPKGNCYGHYYELQCEHCGKIKQTKCEA